MPVCPGCSERVAAVKALNPNISPDVLKALATPAGGEPNPDIP